MSTEQQPAVIDGFVGPWEFLDNSFPVPVHLDGRRYPSVAHALAASRATERADWEETKVAVVRRLVEEKFRDPELRARLLATGGAELVADEADTFWGGCSGKGQNSMGLILMAVRAEARRQSEPGSAPQPQAEALGESGGGALDCAARALIPTVHGSFTAWGYRGVLQGEEQVALTLGPIRGQERLLVRVHSECLTGEAWGSLRCDCGPQLDAAMAAVAAEGAGVILYLRGHEGRGIGLLAKLRAYALQDAGFDTVDANSALGLPADARDYRMAAQILTDLGVRSIRLLSNNPDKVESLTRFGIDVVERVPLYVTPTAHSIAYLRTKRDRMGHDLPELGVAGRAS
ncbi:GTP cyclohydrolase II [Streptacidiphilus rugosus]|uniref:GTP cyclohydrolase II n=1 Tax=Streptacidiphilus rugosus TaxID=405783 RepID=UPI000690E496|nr:GTP cyclohydrolase II [Streptacidiphilus rugosus]